MIKTYMLDSPRQKCDVARKILESLTDWFGNVESRENYISESREMPVAAAEHDGEIIGFLAIKVHYPSAAELAVMGVLPGYHRLGAGRALVSECERYCAENKIEFLQVKTLDESAPHEGYAKTRKFYLSMGFTPLERFPLLWDEDNPCLMLIKHIGVAD